MRMPQFAFANSAASASESIITRSARSEPALIGDGPTAGVRQPAAASAASAAMPTPAAVHRERVKVVSMRRKDTADRAGRASASGGSNVRGRHRVGEGEIARRVHVEEEPRRVAAARHLGCPYVTNVRKPL